MYISAFWVGVAATLLLEVALFVTAVIWTASKGEKK